MYYHCSVSVNTYLTINDNKKYIIPFQYINAKYTHYTTHTLTRQTMLHSRVTRAVSTSKHNELSSPSPATPNKALV